MRKIFLANFKSVKDKDQSFFIGGDKYDNDLLKIFSMQGFYIEIFNIWGSNILKIKEFFKLCKKLFFRSKSLYFFRYPLFYINNRSYYAVYLYQWVLYKFMKISRNKICVIVSDLDFVRNEGFKNTYKDIRFLKNFDYIIVHNAIMKDFLIENGLDEKKLINQEIGNNLSDDFILPQRRLSKILVFSGNLSKSKFLFKFTNENIVSYKINLYGIGFNKKNENKILKYKGSYSSEDIVKILDGSFGLIWDGDDINICSGLYGEYTKINNPSKFSQYIVAGLPIIVWSKSALASLVKKYDIGFYVDNLYQVDEYLNKMTEYEYNRYLKNVLCMRNLIMKGYHFKKSINEVLNKIKGKDHNGKKL